MIRIVESGRNGLSLSDWDDEAEHSPTFTKICETLNCGILDVIALEQDEENTEQE